jgi:hypothetical protein
MDSLSPVIGWKTNRVPHPGEVREDASRVWVAGQLNLRTNEVAEIPVLQELRQWCPVLGADYFWLADNTANERQSGNGFRTSVPLRRDLSLFAIESERYVS